MPLATGTSRFFANVDLTLCWAQKPSTSGTMKHAIQSMGEIVSAPSGGPARPDRRVFGFLTLRLQRLARGRIRKRLLELGFRLLAHVRVLQRGDRRRDRRLERCEVGCEPCQLLEELRRRRVGCLLRTVPERVVLRLELLGRVVELLLQLVAGFEVRRTEAAQLRDELVGGVPGVVELLAERVGGERLAADVGE